MMAIQAPQAPLDERLVVFQYLQQHETATKNLGDLPLPSQHRKKIVFVTTFLSLFPGRISQEKFDPKLFQMITRVKNCFREFLAKRGEGPIDQLSDLPDTQKFIRDRKTKIGISEEDYFQYLSESFYRILPFPTRILCYPEFPRQVLREIDNERRLGFNTLCSRLQQREKQVFYAKDSFALARLLYNGAALGTEESPVFFRDLLATWAEESLERQTCIQEIFLHLYLQKWSSAQGEAFREFQKIPRNTTFQQFLIFCTIEDLEKLLGFPFFLPTLEKMQKDFEEELVRADVAYFVAARSPFLFLQENSNRLSRRWLKSLEVFSFYQHTYEIPLEKKCPLLQLILSSAPRQVPEKVPPYSFEEGWKCMEVCLCAILRQDEIRWHPISQELTNLLNDSTLFPFLVHLHSREQTWALSRLSGILCVLKRLVDLSLSMVFDFFRENPTPSDPEKANVFSRVMHAVIEEVKKHRRDLHDFAFLCFSPPIVVKDTHLEQILGREEEVVADFFASLPRVFLEEEEEEKAEEVQLNKKKPDKKREAIQKLLRCRIFEEKDYLFMLELFREDLATLGISNPTVFFALHVLDSKWGCQKLPSIEQRREALMVVMQINKSIPLPPKGRFDLYLEVMRLKVRGEEVQLRKMSAFVEKLRALYPSLEISFLLYLLKAHPEPPFEAFEDLVRIREEILQEIPKRFYFDQEKNKAFLRKIDAVCLSIEEALSPRHMRDFREALTRSVFWPDQPITDFCKIVDFEFHWREVGLVKHWGQLVATSRETVYLNWNLNFNGFPQLFMMAYDSKKFCARSASVSLNIGDTELKRLEKDRRQDIFHFLYECAGYAFHEDQEKGFLDAVLKDPKWHWKEKVRKGELAQNHMEGVIQFVREAKIAYRALFFPELSQKGVFNPLPTAAIGSIYPIGRGSLIPSYQYLVEFHRHCYVPDAKEVDLEKLRTELFSNESEGKLDIFLSIMGNDGKEKQVPILFEVQSEIDAMAKATPYGEMGIDEEDKNSAGDTKYITLSFPSYQRNIRVPLQYLLTDLQDPSAFQRKFDLHNLILKSLAYQYELHRD